MAQSVYTDITRETAQQLSGSLKNVFDKEAVQSELDLQVQVTQAFDQNRQAAKAEINKAHDTAKAQLDAGEITQAEYDAKVAQLNGIGFVLDSVASGLSTPSNSVSGSLIATASPLVTQKVGELFKTGGALYEYEGTVLHGVAQGVVAAAVAAAGDNNALSAGLAAGSAEVLAPKVSQFLYGTSDADKLTSEQKQTVSAILGMAGSALGATVGNSGADVVVSGGLAQNAVENNGLKEDALKKLGDVRKYLDAKSREALDGLIDAYKKGDIELAKKYKSQLDDAIEAWATSGGYEVLGVNPKAAVGAMVYATGELLIPTNVTELVPVGKLSKATKAIKNIDDISDTMQVSNKVADSLNKTDFISVQNQVIDIRKLSENQRIALEREAYVAALSGGEIAVSVNNKNGVMVLEDIWITDSKGNRLTGIDVIGKNGELILVGGPGKNSSDMVWKRTESALYALKNEATKKGVKAQVYYKRGNSDRFKDLIEKSEKILGKGNVIVFD